MGRAPCCDKEGLKKGPWAPEEDKILVDYIQSNGHGSWRSLPKLAVVTCDHGKAEEVVRMSLIGRSRLKTEDEKGLLRCGKSCRLRWTNYLRPDIKRGPFTPEEQKSIIQLHGIVGNKWSTIAAQLPGRTDNEVKNYWNTHLKKRLVKMGIDPYTYSPATTPSSPATLSPTTATSTSATRHMAQWESARLEAEARLTKQSLLFSTTTSVAPTTVSGSQEQPVSNKTETDFFLRIWNSDVGQSFRQVGGLNSPQVGCKSEAEVACCDWSGSDDLAGDESYQLYLNLVGGDDVELNRSLFYGEFESFSLLASDDERCLEGGFKWDVESDRV